MFNTHFLNEVELEDAKKTFAPSGEPSSQPWEAGYFQDAIENVRIVVNNSTIVLQI